MSQNFFKHLTWLFQTIDFKATRSGRSATYFVAFEQNAYNQKDWSQNDWRPIIYEIRGDAGAKYIGGIIAAKALSKKYASSEPPHENGPLITKL